MACAAIMQRKWRCRVGTAPRVVAEKLDVAFDLGVEQRFNAAAITLF